MTAFITPPTPRAFKKLDADELTLSMQQSLQHWDQKTDLWLFAYGSLIWRPDFEFVEQRPAILPGFHRSLCLWSRINRGTPEKPGIVFALDEGGECEGIIYRIAADQVNRIFPPLWQREMPSGAYNPKWVNCQSQNQTFNALAFVIDRNTDAYAPSLSVEQLRTVIHAGYGINGACIEYVMQTASALKLANITDPKLEHLVQHL